MATAHFSKPPCCPFSIPVPRAPLFAMFRGISSLFRLVSLLEDSSAFQLYNSGCCHLIWTALETPCCGVGLDYQVIAGQTRPYWPFHSYSTFFHSACGRCGFCCSFESSFFYWSSVGSLLILTPFSSCFVFFTAHEYRVRVIAYPHCFFCARPL